jgi:hypothetical protein
MDDLTYTKGIYTATVTVRQLDDGLFQGLVSLARDDATDLETTSYEVDTPNATALEALEEGKALAHRILGDIEL